MIEDIHLQLLNLLSSFFVWVGIVTRKKRWQVTTSIIKQYYFNLITNVQSSAIDTFSPVGHAATQWLRPLSASIPSHGQLVVGLLRLKRQKLVLGRQCGVSFISCQVSAARAVIYMTGITMKDTLQVGRSRRRIGWRLVIEFYVYGVTFAMYRVLHGFALWFRLHLHGVQCRRGLTLSLAFIERS